MPKPALRTELVVSLSLLAAAALLVGVATSVLAVGGGLGMAFVGLLVILEVLVFALYGRALVNRLVLGPLARLSAAADAVAAGDLDARAGDAETQDFSLLAERVNHMTDRLLDAQGQLVRSEKLASIGRLSAGVAHEIGNPLGAIGTYLDVLRRRGGDPEVVAGLGRELERIDRIVRSLLDYARPHEESPRPVDAAAIAAGAFRLLEAQGAFREARAELQVVDSAPLRILGRAHLLEQALVNLILNAVDAAPRGRVVVGARAWAYEPGRAPPPRRTSDPGAAMFPRAPERRPSRIEFRAGQPGVLVYVADSGPGVPPEHRERIFEPFFTTKEPGRGTGLGLAIVARTVHDMGGVVWVDPAREGGAAFKIFFPVIPSLHEVERGPGGEA